MKLSAPGQLGFVRRLGPGLITGAADDDPSGIPTYSQVSAQFGCAAVMLVATNSRIMGRLTLSLPTLVGGSMATAVMAAASVGFFVL